MWIRAAKEDASAIPSSFLWPWLSSDFLVPSDNRTLKLPNHYSPCGIASFIGRTVTKTWNNVGLEIISEIVFTVIHNTWPCNAGKPLYMEIQELMANDANVMIRAFACGRGNSPWNNQLINPVICFLPKLFLLLLTLTSLWLIFLVAFIIQSLWSSHGIADNPFCKTMRIVLRYAYERSPNIPIYSLKQRDVGFVKFEMKLLAESLRILERRNVVSIARVPTSVVYIWTVLYTMKEMTTRIWNVVLKQFLCLKSKLNSVLRKDETVFLRLLFTRCDFTFEFLLRNNELDIYIYIYSRDRTKWMRHWIHNSW